MNVSLKRSFTNINYYKSIFGGSIFSACDPFFPIMYYHIFKEKKLIVWTKSAEIQYLSPAKSSLKLNSMTSAWLQAETEQFEEFEEIKLNSIKSPSQRPHESHKFAFK